MGPTPKNKISDWRNDMVKAVRFYETGGPEVLRYEDAEVGDPGPGNWNAFSHGALSLGHLDVA